MSISLKPLDRQVVVITGASSGIGMATALTAAHKGAKVVLAARSQQTLDAVATVIAENGGEAVVVCADVGVRADVQRIADTAIERFGRIDTWINNAGIGIFGRLDDTTVEDGMRLFETNFWGVVNGSQVALPHLRSNGGALINLGSEVSEAPAPLQGMYSASKHAVKGFTDALRIELQADEAPVSVTLIQPSAVDTPFAENAGTYLSQEPMLPSPMIDPERVVSAILDAAVKPARDVKVGAVSVIDTAFAKFLPGLRDVVVKAMIGRQQRNEAPHARQGTLYDAGECGRIHGRGSDNAADPAQAKQSNLRPA